jgi:cell division transport system ATP-binding protein
MTVYENVEFALRVTNVPSRFIRKRVSYVLGLVGLGDKARSYPSQLSGGQQQRVALARALVNNPAIIIADEPTGNVDPEMSHEIVELLNEINHCGTTILMVTHEHSLVHEFGRRVITIRDGKVESDIPDGGADK